jgi:hypothetical protein
MTSAPACAWELPMLIMAAFRARIRPPGYILPLEKPCELTCWPMGELLFEPPPVIALPTPEEVLVPCAND